MKAIPFSNGSEFTWFESTWCCTCTKYGEVDCEEENECPIYVKMLLAMWDENLFPHEKVMRVLNLPETLPRMKTVCVDYTGRDEK